MFRFANPHLLWLLWLVPLMIVALLLLVRMRRSALKRFGNYDTVKQLLRDVSSWRVYTKFILFTIAFACVVIAEIGRAHV